MKLKIFCRCGLFPSWSGEGLISTPVMLMKGSKIQRIELRTVYLYQQYSLFMHNKLQ